MQSNKPNRRQAKRLGAMVAAGVLLLDAVVPAYATVSQLPGLYVTPPDPNVMFTLDDSGSMQSDALPDYSVTGEAYTNVPNNASSAYLQNVRGLWYPNMWGSGSSYLAKEYYQLAGSTTSKAGVGRYMRSSSGNPLYYDPNVLYQPWPQAGNNAARMTPANPAAVNIDPDDPTDTSYTLNLNTRQGTGTAETDGYWRATYFVYKGSTPLKYGTPSDSNNISTNFTKYEIQGSGTATFPKGSNRTDCVTTAGVCTRVEEMQNFANWLQYYRNRRLMAKGASAEAFAKQGTNVRTGFAMIGKRTVVQRTMRAFTGTDRTDFFTKLYTTSSSNGGTPLRKAMDDVGAYFMTSNVNSPWAQTPGTSIGTEYSCRRNFHVMATDGFWNGAAGGTGASANNDSYSGNTPTKPDGTAYAYSDSGSSANDPLVGQFGINPFKDSNSQTLADVAAYYWKTDLRSTLANNVPSTARDPAFWQHVTTFTMGLGISGTGRVKRHSDGTTTISSAAATASPFLTPYIGHTWLADQAVRDWLVQNRVVLDWTTPSDDADTTGDDLIHASMNGRGRYFSATNPTQVAAGLASALAEATDNPGSLANVVTQSAQVSEGSAVYQATYNPSQWSGRFYAFGQSANGTVNTTPSTALWEASNKMPTPDNRNIFTWNPVSKAGALFTWATLTPTQQSNLGSDSTVLDFLRGSNAKEAQQGGTFRDRARYTVAGVTGGVLGDVVNGSPIKGPSDGAGYDRLPSGTPGQGTYLNYRSSASTALDNMRNTLFLGANDGMLHAFDRSNGVERFAFVPNAVYSVPRSPTGTELKLKMLSDPGYVHRFTVDGPPQIADAFIGTNAASAAWKTLLLGSTGAGARAVFAMDITDPTVSTSAFGASKLMWEFSEADNADMGYVTGYPHAARMRDGTWVAMFGNGYDSTNGQAKLFLLNLQTGAVVWQQSVGAAGGNGLSQPNFTVNNNREVTAIYAGDLKGNIWKFDVDNADPTQWKVAFGSAPNYSPLYTGSANQPITVMPELTFHPSGGVVVSYGTGKLLDVEDTSNIVPPGTGSNINLYTQSLYGIWDKPGESVGFSGTGSLVLQGANTSLAAAADSAANVTGSTSNTVDWTTKRGWYMSLQSGGERVNVNPQQVNSVLLIVTNKPDSDPCKSGGTSRLFALDPITGSAPSFAVFDSNGVGGITAADKGYNVKSFTFGVLSLPTLQTKKAAVDVVTSERAGSRGQTGARLGGVEPGKGTTSQDCVQWLLAGGSNASIAGVDIATCKAGTPRISWRQLK